MSPRAKSNRDGKPRVIEAKFLVPHYSCFGNRADCFLPMGRIVEADSLFINEAMLTGESVPVGKKVIRLKGQKVGKCFCGDKRCSSNWQNGGNCTGDKPESEGLAVRY